MVIRSFKLLGAERVPALAIIVATPICAQAQLPDPNDQINETINREQAQQQQLQLLLQLQQEQRQLQQGQQQLQQGQQLQQAQQQLQQLQQAQQMQLGQPTPLSSNSNDQINESINREQAQQQQLQQQLQLQDEQNRIDQLQLGR